MTAGGFSAGADLPSLATRLRGASDDLDGLAGGIPDAPDAGAATSTLTSMLATIVASVGNLSIDAQEAVGRLDASSTTYSAADQWAAFALPTAD